MPDRINSHSVDIIIILLLLVDRSYTRYCLVALPERSERGQVGLNNSPSPPEDPQVLHDLLLVLREEARLRRVPHEPHLITKHYWRETETRETRETYETCET